MKGIEFNKKCIGILFFCLYAFCALINNKFSFPLQLLGFILLLYIVPQSILSILRMPKLDLLESILTYTTIYFICFVPFYFLLTLFGFPIGKWQILIIALVLFAMDFFFTKQKPILISRFVMREWIKSNTPLLIALTAFTGMHILNFYFYQYIPEGDGYLDMARIEKTVESGHIAPQYRAIFNLSMSLLSAFGNIAPYRLFSFWIPVLEITGLISLFLLIKKYHFKDSVLQLLILFSAMSIPVLNMEIDYVRPQTIFVILFPIYLYFLYIALQSKNILWWGFSTGIAIIGVSYHQFFLFILLSHGFLLCFNLFKKYFFGEKKNKIIFILGCILFVSVFLNTFFLFLKNTTLLKENSYYIDTIILAMQQFNWQWWFLSHYPAEAQSVPMGWTGITGAIKFYSYYGGPVTFLTLLIISYCFYEYRRVKADSFIISVLPLLFLFLFFAEILPRINRPLIPERFWLPMDMLFLFISIPLWRKLSSIFKKELLYSVFTLAILIGVSGSLYIAHEKTGAIISENDTLSVPWIKGNTEVDAIFISQSSNDALFSYLFQRKMIGTLPKEQWADTSIKNNLTRIRQEFTTNDNSTISCPPSMDEAQATQCIADLNTFISNKIDARNQQTLSNNLLTSPLYIYYSEDRFHNIFNQREWWRMKNYADIDLEKLNHLYSLVYNKNGVFIWKVN